MFFFKPVQALSGEQAVVLHLQFVLKVSTIQSASRFTPWQTCSIELHLDFSEKTSSHEAIQARKFSYTNVHHCLESGTHLSELERCGVNELP